MENNHLDEQTVHLSSIASDETQASQSGVSTTQIRPAETVNNTSYFDGKTIQLIGWRLLGLLLTGITLGIGAPWAECMILRWEARHTVINGKRLCFTGRGLQLLGRYLLWGLLTLITLGIYAIFIPVRMEKWRVSHTYFENGNPAPKQSSVSAGVIVGIIGGIALFLSVVILAVALLLPNLADKPLSKPTEPSGAMPPFHWYIDTQITTLPEEPDGSTGEILYVVANGGLNLRTGPGQEYDIIGNLPDGSSVTVQGRQNGWVFTGEGWCSADYLSAEAPASNIPGVASLYGNWLVVTDFSRSEYGDWCRGGAITLNADGTFAHSMCDYFRQYDFGWYCPGGETSGGDCPNWKGTYTFNGSHLILNYQYEEVNDYAYAEDGSPLYQGSHWEPVSKAVTLRVSLSNTGDLLLGHAADIPVYTIDAMGSSNTYQTLYRLPGDADTFQSVSDGLNQVLPN